MSISKKEFKKSSENVNYIASKTYLSTDNVGDDWNGKLKGDVYYLSR